MNTCPTHGYYSGQFCSECSEGDHSAQAHGFRLFNEDRALGQNQYASRYVDGRHGSQDLGSDLRWMGDPSDYHNLYIHVDDYDTFHRRLREHKASLTPVDPVLMSGLIKMLDNAASTGNV